MCGGGGRRGRMAGRVVSCTTQENLPVTDQEAAAAVAAVHEMLGPGQVDNLQLHCYSDMRRQITL